MDEKVTLKKEELYKLDSLKIYKEVLKGDIITRFPKNYWNNSNAIEDAKICTRHLIEDILKLDDDSLKEKLNTKLFKDHKLGGMLDIVFKGSPYKAINSIYPGKFFPWEFKVAPTHLWKDKENGIRATRWLVEQHLKLNEEELKEQLSRDLFRNNGLRGMLRHCFNDSPYEAINTTYPNKYKKSDFRTYQMKEKGVYRQYKKE